MSSYVLHGNPYILPEFRDAETGLRPSFQKLLELIDMDDPAWPATAAVLREMAEAGVEIDETALSIAAKLGAYRLAKLGGVKPNGRDVPYDGHEQATFGSIVYYVRRGPVIKIGWTAVPAGRFIDLLPDEILAFEPGGVKEETLRHRQFAHLRCQGEHFRPAPELLEHVRLTREKHGDPHPDWPTIASMAKSRDIREMLPPLKSEETVTADEARDELGINEGWLQNWIWRGRITPAGYSDDGQELYYAEHLRELCRRPNG